MNAAIHIRERDIKRAYGLVFIYSKKKGPEKWNCINQYKFVLNLIKLSLTFLFIY